MSRMAVVLNAQEIGENTPASILSRTRKKKVRARSAHCKKNTFKNWGIRHSLEKTVKLWRTMLPELGVFNLKSNVAGA
jgi:hypothetical protein